MLSFFKSKKMPENLTVIEKLKDFEDVMPTADVLNFLGKLTDAYREAKITERELAVLATQKEILLTEIEKKYDLYQTIFNRIFDERAASINKSFEVIDQGLKNGDRDLINMGLHSLSKVVSSSPFGNVKQLSDLLEGNQTIEI